jgi:hypothetical protein
MVHSSGGVRSKKFRVRRGKRGKRGKRGRK